MRKTGRVTLASGVVLSLAMAAPVGAHEFEAGSIVVAHPWLRAPADRQSSASLYMVIRNTGDTAEKLTGAASDKVGKVVVHGDPKNIVFPPGIFIPPHSEIELEPGGAFVGLHEVSKMNPVGWGFEVDLVFEKSGKVTIEAAVEAPDARHAHDAEAMARWEKTHAAPADGTPAEAARPPAEAHHLDAAAEHHHHHHEAEAERRHDGAEGKTFNDIAKGVDGEDAAEAARQPNAGDEAHHEDAADAKSPQDSDAQEPMQDEAAEVGTLHDASPEARYEAERNSMDHSKQDFGLPGIPPMGSAQE